jgi:hypothetical protein
VNHGHAGTRQRVWDVRFRPPCLGSRIPALNLFHRVVLVGGSRSGLARAVGSDTDRWRGNRSGQVGRSGMTQQSRLGTRRAVPAQASLDGWNQGLFRCRPREANCICMSGPGSAVLRDVQPVQKSMAEAPAEAENNSSGRKSSLSSWDKKRL